MELKKMIEVISVQTGILNELLLVLERESTEMGDVNTTAMNVSNEAKEELIARIAEHAPHIKQAVSKLAVNNGLPGTASLGTVAELVAKGGSPELLAKQQQILRTAERVQQAAALNREIAERFASSVSTSLNLITRLINQSNVYGASGDYQQRPAGAVMINREA